MTRLHGRDYGRSELRAHAGALAQFAGVRLMELADGVERGIRVLEFRTGTGFQFTVLVDRALDIGDCSFKGAAIGWHSPSGFRHPGLHEADGEGGLGFLRSFSGLLVTCGLDHTLFMEDEEGGHYHYGARKTLRHPLHGRVAFVPARLGGYGERWDGEVCTLWCEGLVQQSAVFGEDLHLIRRIEAVVGGNALTIQDRVVNNGYYTTPHMMLYHINVGHPVLAEGSRYLAPVREVPWAVHAEHYRQQGVGYRRLGAPQPIYDEQVWEFEMGADAAGTVPVALVNDGFDGGRGLGFMVESQKDQLPCHYQWQHLQAGQYTVGLEPSTHHVLGKAFARERGELIQLEAGQARDYAVRMAVLDGTAEIEAAAARIQAIAAQPDDDYPAPTGRFAALPGGRR